MATPEQLPTVRRRDRQREETRRELALAAFELARAHGLADVRVPEIAAAVGVSPRTFNNYFSSKQAAIAWPAVQRAMRMSGNLRDRPPDESIGVALEAAIAGLYEAPREAGLPTGWLREFRKLVAAEPSLHGEYLKASRAAELALGQVIADRMGLGEGELRPQVLAAMVVGAERAAVMHWMAQRKSRGSLVASVRAAVQEAVSGIG